MKLTICPSFRIKAFLFGMFFLGLTVLTGIYIPRGDGKPWLMTLLTVVAFLFFAVAFKGNNDKRTDRF